MRTAPPHSDAAHASITAELLRLTLHHHASTDEPCLVWSRFTGGRLAVPLPWELAP